MKLADLRGLTRSLMMYYGVPGQARRLHSFYQPFISPGDLCFDIGAHVGNRMRAWLALGARVVALEPQPTYLGFLEFAYGRNPSVTLIGKAAGAERGETRMMVSGNAPTVSSLSAEWVEQVKTTDETFSWVEWNGELRVQVVTLEDLIAEHGEPTFVKIDVEGYELEVLKGLRRPLKALSFEYLRSALPMAEACMERIQELAEYEFNFTVIEETEFAAAGWMKGEEMMRVLRTLPDRATSGDVYARKKGNV
ncbi:MAG: FkbM family methyltransferase [Anaerolineae bacterium]|nr:MAG: FkbM family methyltransferase [Anaerolineae bacterium]